MGARLEERATTHIDGVLESILRGAAISLGCSSANLIVFSEKEGEVRVRVGTIGERLPMVGRVEGLIGSSLSGVAFPISDVGDSLVYASWRERTVTETSSLGELVGSFVPAVIAEQIASLIGEHRFICVPVLSGGRDCGVIIFEKEGAHPFSRQQRELFLRYAQRIGEIIDNDVRGRAITMAEECTVCAFNPRRGRSVEDQLLHLAFGQTAPALLVDPRFRVTSCNQATEEQFGYRADQLVGQEVAQLFQAPGDAERVLNHHALAATDGHFEEATVLRHQDGRLLPGKLRALLLADAQNQVIGFLVLLQGPAHEAARTSREGASALMRQERLATMGEMAAQLAHEIRGPLLSIGATLGTLVPESEAIPGLEGTLDTLLQEVGRLDMVLKDYLSLAARRGAALARVDLATVLGDAIRLLEGVQRVSGKRIVSAVAAPVEVNADPDGLKQVLFNLLRNALDASPRGGTVRCHATHGASEVSVHIDDEGSGPGASSEDCFSPFFTTKSNGTGLGLTVCRRIVEAHGGAVTLRSRAEGGARASVVLPVGRVS